MTKIHGQKKRTDETVKAHRFVFSLSMKNKQRAHSSEQGQISSLSLKKKKQIKKFFPIINIHPYNPPPRFSDRQDRTDKEARMLLKISSPLLCIVSSENKTMIPKTI
ncbi:MAG TPA: hypothetical protein DDE71_08555 [Tenacibaculum sp.]|nr:hypothetical protein [Tenacibaculum sp.]